MSSILDQIKNALFYKADNKEELDLKKLAGLLGFGLTASGAIDFGPETPAVGYSKPVPKFNAVRNRVQNTYDPNRRPGSGGQYFFTPTEYVRQSDSLFGDDFESYADDLQTAKDAAATQAKGLETLNTENLASYPAPVVTTPEETNTGIASLPSIPTAEQQLAGQVNLGMANGGIVGLKKGTWGDWFSDLGSSIKNVASNITGVGNPANEGKSFIGADTWTYGANSEGEGGFTLQTPEAALASGNLDQDIYDMHTQTGKYENMRPDGTSRDRDIHDANPMTEYSKAVASLGNSAINEHARATSFMGGSDYDTTAARAAAGADIDMGVYNNELVGMPVTTMFHGIPITQTVVGYNDENGVFRAVLPDDAKTALAQGNVTMLNNAQEMDAYRNPTASTGGDNSAASNAVTTIEDQVNAITQYDQYVEDQNIPIVDGYAVFDKNKHTMGGFDIGTGQSNNSIAVYVDDNGVVRYSNGQEFGGPPDVVQSIREAAGYVDDSNITDNTGGNVVDNTTTDNAVVWSAETYPVMTNIFSSLGPGVPTTINSFDAQTATNYIAAITNFAELGTVDEQTADITFYESIANGTVAEDYPDDTINGVSVAKYFEGITDADRMAFQARADLYKKLQELDKEEINSAIQELKDWSDFLGTYGQAGTGGAAYGGAIKGYAMGGMGQSPDLPSGLLKSTEDGMADTIPAQMGNQPINLSGGEYIMDAETVAFLGNGNTDAGAQKLDNFRENLRMAKNGGEDQGNQINSENFLGRLQQMGVA